MKLEKGKKYLTGLEEIVEVVKINENTATLDREILYDSTDDRKTNLVYLDGSLGINTYENDLISEYVEEKVTGTDDTGFEVSYYILPVGATQIQDLIEHKEMNFSVGNILKSVYRLGNTSRSTVKRDLEKIIFFAQRELNRISI